MACQSLDNDEILNVRWATEDPNPVTKVIEKRRLEDMGQEAIRERMDPRIVDAMRAVRALEDGDVLEEEDDPAPDAKRRRIEYTHDEEQEGDEDDELPSPPQAQSEAPPQARGLLTADAMEGLKYFAEIRKRNGATLAVPSQKQRRRRRQGWGLLAMGATRTLIEWYRTTLYSSTVLLVALSDDMRVDLLQVHLGVESSAHQLKELRW